MLQFTHLTESAIRLVEITAEAQWRGADPYDGLGWHWPRVIVDGPRRRQLIAQAHARTPVDIRRLYGRGGVVISKALAVFASATLRVNALVPESRWRQLALAALERLAEDRQAGEAAWGYPWYVQTRWSFYPAGSPNVVCTAFAVASLLEAERELGRTDLGDRARAAAHWVLETLWAKDGGFFTYHPYSETMIHNASLLGAWLVWAACGEDSSARERVSRAVERTLAAQRSDGSWGYGEGHPSLHWSDSFHTGYVLTCMERLRELDPRITDAVARGGAFYRRFFGPRGEARLWSDREYPEDGHSAGTGLTTIALLSRRGVLERTLLEDVADRVLAVGIRRGHAVFRAYRWNLRTSVIYPRWCDAHVALGLADAAALAAGRADLAPTPSALDVGRPPYTAT